MRVHGRIITLVFASLCLTACAGHDDGEGSPIEQQTESAQPEAAQSPSAPAQSAEAEPAEEAAADSAMSATPPQARIFGTGTSCSPNPCQNAGRCVDLWLGYRCECPAGFTGARCETPAATCYNYTLPTAGKCAGYYCGLTQTQLATRLSPFAACNQSASFTCGGALPREADACSREMKTANPFDSNAQLRPKIAACLRARPALANVSISSRCVDCFTAFETCVNDRCLIECLAGDSPSCDTCRRNSGCYAPLYSCSGLPTP